MLLFASDFDGTLFHRDPIDFESVKDLESLIQLGYRSGDIKQIKKFQNDGNKFGLCTGRALISAVDFLDEDITPDFYITNSGAAIFDRYKNLIDCCSFDFNTVKNMLAMLPEKGLSITTTENFYVAPGMEFLVKNPVYVHSFNADDKKEKVIGISINMRDEKTALDTKYKLEEKFKDIEVFQNQNCLDCAPKGASKGIGLRKTAQYFKADETAAAGDSYNDLPMLESAKYSYTFKDAPKIVQEKAGRIVSGIAEAIEHFTSQPQKNPASI